MINVTLTRTHQNPPEIKKGSVRRSWMDETYQKHAYKCLPLTEANTSGWEVLLQQDVVVQWDGGYSVPRVLSGETMTFSVGGSTYERSIVQPSIIGIMSFNVGWTFSTPENIATWVSGSPNYFIDGAVPLTAHIPSSWWPDEFNMNWKITTVGQPVRFPAGMPFMFFQFYDTRLMPAVDFTVENYWDKPDLMQERSRYGEAKARKMTEQPWTWMGGIRTGLNENGERIGPMFVNHPTLKEPRNG
jgi:hypothetical protein